jgi:glutamate formiminotransferase/formiminotetrahydrofolate cyclodeaminase
MLSAGKYYLQKQQRSTGIPTKEIIHIAVKSMGLDDLSHFDPNKKIIEYLIRDLYGPLVSMTIHSFSDDLSSNSPAPGGGSVSALAGVLGASLSSMVANLTFGKKKWLPKYDQMCAIAENCQKLKYNLLELIDADTEAFNVVMETFQMPKKTDKQNKTRNLAIDTAMKEASKVPLETLKCCRAILDLTLEAAKHGNPSSVSDAGVAAEMASAGAHGAALNVLINLNDIQDTRFCNKMEKETQALIGATKKGLTKARKTVSKIMNDA